MHLFIIFSCAFVLVNSKAVEDVLKRAAADNSVAEVDVAKRTIKEDCYEGIGRDSDYNGVRSVTLSGYACKDWDDAPGSYRGKGPSNYCRNPAPSSQTSPWCYLKDALYHGQTWQSCGVPKCGTGCYEDQGRDYAGTASTSIDGSTCKSWSDSSISSAYRGKGESNYCRNPLPSSQNSPWCYTDDGWQTCGIPMCGTQGECKTTYNGLEYNGRVQEIWSGTNCEPWKTADSQYGFPSNFCRATDGYKPWCQTYGAIEYHWYYCDVSYCYGTQQQVLNKYCESYSRSKSSCSGVAHARKDGKWRCYMSASSEEYGDYCVSDSGDMVECEKPEGEYCTLDEEIQTLMSTPKQVEATEDVSSDEYTAETDNYIDVLAESGIDSIQIGFGQDCFLQWAKYEGFLNFTCGLKKGIPWYISKHETANLYKIGTNNRMQGTENMNLRYDNNQLGVRVRPVDGVGMAMVYPDEAMDDFWGEPQYPGFWIKKINGKYAIGYDNCPLTISPDKGKNWAYFKCGSEIRDTFWIKASSCAITKAKISDEDDAQAMSEGEEILGVVTSASCIEGSGLLTFTESREVTNEVTIESGSSTEVNFGVTLGMEVETGANAIFASVTTTFSAEVSVGGAVTWSSSKAQSSSTSQSKGGAFALNVVNPGAAMIVGFVKKYNLDKSQIPVNYTVECDGGQYFTYESVIRLKSQTYGHTHYKTLQGTFNKDTCRSSGATECIYQIDSASYKSVKEPEDAFNACFANGRGTVDYGKRSEPIELN